MDEKDFRVPPLGPVPLPEPAHQRRITREKWFEIGAVVMLVLAGTGYLAWRDAASHRTVNAASTLAESAKAIENAGGQDAGKSMLLDRQCLSYTKAIDSFEWHVDLVGLGPDQPLETAVIWLTPLRGNWPPSERTLQEAVNTVGVLGQDLVQSSSGALEKAAKTMEFVDDTNRPHDKGVAGTNDGWKVTYVAYRSFDEKSAPQPVLYLILQPLSAGSDPALAEFNRTLYRAVDEGVDVKSAIRSSSGAAAQSGGASGSAQ